VPAQFEREQPNSAHPLTTPPESSGYPLPGILRPPSSILAESCLGAFRHAPVVSGTFDSDERLKRERVQRLQSGRVIEVLYADAPGKKIEQFAVDRLSVRRCHRSV
jgi:hypothetical protein